MTYFLRKKIGHASFTFPLNMYNPNSVKQLKFFIAASANQSLEYIELVTPSQLVSISCSTLYKNSELDLTSASTGYNYKQLGAITSRALIATQVPKF